MLCRNDVYRFKTSSNRVRVLALDTDTDVAWTFSLDRKNARPERDTLSRLNALLQSGRIELISGATLITAVRATKAAKKRAERAWTRIEPLVADPGIFDPSERFRLIQERANAVDCTSNTIYAHLRAWWAGGQTALALLGKFHLSGRRGSGETANRGEKPSLANRKIFQLTEKDIQHIEKAIKAYYLGNDKATVPKAYQRLREKYYSVVDGNNDRVVRPQGECPSLRQFRRILKQRFKLEVVIRKREGDTKFERDHRPMLSSVVANCVGVGHVYEIDATIMDVFLVARKHRSRIIGKPTLYLIYDRKSRLIVGFYVGLESASWPAAMLAIVSIAEDKGAMCARYRVKYDPADWPAHSLYPKEFVGDRGEMLSKSSRNVVSGLEITATNCPRERPDFKGTVECGFKLIQQSMADSLPGYEPPDNFRKRRGKRYERDASLSLDELISEVLAAIIAHNRKPMSGYPLSTDMLSRGVHPSPLEVWRDDQARRAGALTRFPEEFVRFSLMPQDKATVTDKGIRFRGCFYTCTKAVEDGWFVRAGPRVFHVPISFDPLLVDTIYLHDSADRTKFIPATLLMDKSGDYQGLSFAEVAFYEKLRSKQRAEMVDQIAQVESDYHAHVDPIDARARLETRRATKGVSRSARKADTRHDRLEERRERRQEEARMGTPRATALPSPAAVIPFPSPSQPAQGEPAPDPSMPLTLKQRLAMKHTEMLE